MESACGRLKKTYKIKLLIAKKVLFSKPTSREAASYKITELCSVILSVDTFYPYGYPAFHKDGYLLSTFQVVLARNLTL